MGEGGKGGVRKLLQGKKESKSNYIIIRQQFFMLPTCTSNPASWRSPTSGRLPVMEYGLLSPITSFVASLSFLNPSESRLQAIPWCVCQCVCCSKI